MNNEMIYKMLGFAARSGNIASGEGKAQDCVRRGSAGVLVLSEDASDNTRKKMENSCKFYNVPIITMGDRYTLGRAVGREFTVIAAVTNPDMAARILELSQDSSKND